MNNKLLLAPGVFKSSERHSRLQSPAARSPLEHDRESARGLQELRVEHAKWIENLDRDREQLRADIENLHKDHEEALIKRLKVQELPITKLKR